MNKVLVAYFSATGTTKKVAEKLAKATGGNLFEIKPQVEYTSIENVVENIDDYDTVFVGFPVWWYIPPRIIQTFIEKHNLSGKKIITFATSGGSGIKGSTDFLKKNYSELNIIEGKRFGWNESLESIGAWAKKL